MRDSKTPYKTEAFVPIEGEIKTGGVNTGVIARKKTKATGTVSPAVSEDSDATSTPREVAEKPSKRNSYRWMIKKLDTEKTMAEYMGARIMRFLMHGEGGPKARLNVSTSESGEKTVQVASRFIEGFSPLRADRSKIKAENVCKTIVYSWLISDSDYHTGNAGFLTSEDGSIKPARIDFDLAFFRSKTMNFYNSNINMNMIGYSAFFKDPRFSEEMAALEGINPEHLYAELYRSIDDLDAAYAAAGKPLGHDDYAAFIKRATGKVLVDEIDKDYFKILMKEALSHRLKEMIAIGKITQEYLKYEKGEITMEGLKEVYFEKIKDLKSENLPYLMKLTKLAAKKPGLFSDFVMQIAPRMILEGRGDELLQMDSINETTRKSILTLKESIDKILAGKKLTSEQVKEFDSSISKHLSQRNSLSDETLAEILEVNLRKISGQKVNSRLLDHSALGEISEKLGIIKEDFSYLTEKRLKILTSSNMLKAIELGFVKKEDIFEKNLEMLKILTSDNMLKALGNGYFKIDQLNDFTQSELQRLTSDSSIKLFEEGKLSVSEILKIEDPKTRESVLSYDSLMLLKKGFSLEELVSVQKQNNDLFEKLKDNVFVFDNLSAQEKYDAVKSLASVENYDQVDALLGYEPGHHKSLGFVTVVAPTPTMASPVAAPVTPSPSPATPATTIGSSAVAAYLGDKGKASEQLTAKSAQAMSAEAPKAPSPGTAPNAAAAASSPAGPALGKTFGGTTVAAIAASDPPHSEKSGGKVSTGRA